MASFFPLKTILVLVWDELGDGPKYGLTRCWFWVSGMILDCQGGQRPCKMDQPRAENGRWEQMPRRRWEIN